MRESKIASYDPVFSSPLYPAVQILGILAPFWLIVNMGLLPTLFTFGLIIFGATWYTYYARQRVTREGAIFHVFERLGKRRYQGLDLELREIMREQGTWESEPFDEVVTAPHVIDMLETATFEELVTRASRTLATELPVPANHLIRGFLEGTRIGVTPSVHGTALPHLRIKGLAESHMLLVRARHGIRIETEADDELGRSPDEVIQAVFFLVSPEEHPGRHLRILARIAKRVEDESFIPEWLQAQTDQELKEALFHEELMFAIRLEPGRSGEDLIGSPIRGLPLPEGTLVAMIRRSGELIIPRGDTELLDGDRLPLIGGVEGIDQLRELYGVSGTN